MKEERMTVTFSISLPQYICNYSNSINSINKWLKLKLFTNKRKILLIPAGWNKKGLCFVGSQNQRQARCQCQLKHLHAGPSPRRQHPAKFNGDRDFSNCHVNSVDPIIKVHVAVRVGASRSNSRPYQVCYR